MQWLYLETWEVKHLHNQRYLMKIVGGGGICQSEVCHVLWEHGTYGAHNRHECKVTETNLYTTYASVTPNRIRLPLCAREL